MTTEMYSEKDGSELFSVPTIHWMIFVGKLDCEILADGVVAPSDVQIIQDAIIKKSPDKRISKVLISALKYIKENNTNGIMDYAIGITEENKK